MKIYKLELSIPLDAYAWYGESPADFCKTHGILVENDSELTSLTREALESFCADFYYTDGETDSDEVHGLLKEIQELTFLCPGGWNDDRQLAGRHFWEKVEVPK